MAKEYLDKIGLTYFWQKIKSAFLRGNTGGVFYGTCSSGATETTKEVVCSDFVSDDLKHGALIFVRFSATNSGAVASLKLNVNSTGAKPIKYINNGTLGNLPSAGHLKANTTYMFSYDGTNWVVLFNYNTTYSSMTDAEWQAGTGTTARLITPARLKSAILEWSGTILPTKTSDLINDSIETESDGDWTIIKYLPLKLFIAYTKKTVSVSSWTANKSLYYSETITIPMPFLSSIVDYSATANCGNQGHVSNLGSSSSGITFRMVNPSNNVTSTSVTLHLIGTYS